MCIGMASTFAYANSTLREQVSLKVSHPAIQSPRHLSHVTTNPMALNNTDLLPDSSVDEKSKVGLSR